jgi:thiamine-phosphate pyrophosphorylase
VKGGGHQLRALQRAARRLEARRGRGKVPALALFTDPERTRDLAGTVGRLPPGSLVVYRAFGAPDAEQTGRALVRLARRGGLRLLVGADMALAAKIRADGVHLPERLAHLAGPLKRRRPGWLVTAAAHSARAVRRAQAADAVFISPVFPSRSPSAGRPLGVVRLAALARGSRARVHALGGVRAATVARIMMTGAAGFAAVEALSEAS